MSASQKPLARRSSIAVPASSPRMRRLIDVLRQLAESPEVEPALAGALARAARIIDRGIVLESALI